MAYGWIIDKDHIADGEAEPGTLLNAVGLVGPRDIAHEIETRLKAGEGEPFRLYDDDGELYYEGRIIGDHTGWDGFTPLDDFGRPNAGCSDIHYRHPQGAWEAL
ncbi:MAG TPA: hypothetical protein VIR45_13920 [Kiloniellaceae bacterium]